jgi:hypothetical protein
MSARTAEPQCPKCGHREAVQFDLVPIGYEVAEVSSDGTFEINDACSPRQVDEERRFDGIRCTKTGCEYETKIVEEFFPWATEQERAESLIGAVVKMLDGHVVAIDRFDRPPGPDDGPCRISGKDLRGQRWSARPHEVTRVTCICGAGDDPNDHRKDCPHWRLGV